MIRHNRLFPTILLALLTACNQTPVHEAPEPAKLQAVFNQSDKSVMSNGNLVYAVDKLNSGSDSLDGVKTTDIESVSKSPYSSIGNIYRIIGKVYKIEQLPPMKGVSGPWTELLMLANNPNSATGVSTVDCVYSGSPDKINSGTWATCTGYFIGTADTQNILGGQIESFVFVGHAKNGHS